MSSDKQLGSLSSPTASVGDDYDDDSSLSQSGSFSFRGKRKPRLTTAAESVSHLSKAMAFKPAKVSSDRSQLSVVKAQELQGFCEMAMLEIEVKDRRWLMKKYENAFLGTDFVSWVQENVDVVEHDRDKAVAWGQDLLHYGFIRHVVAEHDLKGKL
jgi:hypothetical protein